MKFLLERKKEIYKKKVLDKLINSLSTLNPNGTFKAKTNLSYIRSGLDPKDLSTITLPLGASFIKNPKLSITEFGAVFVKFKKQVFCILCKQLEEGAVLII